MESLVWSAHLFNDTVVVLLVSSSVVFLTIHDKLLIARGQ